MKSTLKYFLLNFYSQPIKYILIVIIIIITLIKLDFFGQGFLSFTDEGRYLKSAKATHDLIKHEPFKTKLGAAINTLFSTQARPGDALIHMLPNALQIASANLFKLNYFEPNNSYPLFIFNYFVYCLILIVLYKLSKLLIKDQYYALLVVLLYSTLTNSYLYLRHALAYDKSLLIFYFLIYKVALFTEKDLLTFKKSFILGFCSFFAYLIYPGYYPLLFVTMLFLLFNKSNYFKKKHYTIYFILGSISCLILTEILSRSVGKSYIHEAVLASHAVIRQGDFEESFIFIIKYLYEIEGITGIIIMISIPVAFFKIVYQNKFIKHNSSMISLSLIITLIYLFYASIGYFLHKMVFFGRILHQYMPYVCILFVFSFKEILNKSIKKNKYLLLIISMVLISNFIFNFINYKSIAYPKDIGWKLSKTYNLNSIEKEFEYDNVLSVDLPNDNDFLHPYKYNDSISKDIIFVNPCTYYPIRNLNSFHLFKPKNNYALIASYPLFFNFKAYQYEGYNIIDRENIKIMNTQIKIYQLKHY